MNRMRRFGCFLLALLLALLHAAGCAPSSGVAPGRGDGLRIELENLRIIAEDTDSYGIGVNTVFVIQTQGNPDPAVLERHLALSPETPFTLLRGSGEGTYRLLPQKSLSHNLIYRVEARSGEGERIRSWAFQTRSPLQVVGAAPNGYQVPAGSGVELLFNRDDVDISRHFSIEPYVEGTFLTYGNRSAFVPKEPLDYETDYTVTLRHTLTANDGSSLGENYTYRFKVEDAPDASGFLRPLSLGIADWSAETFLTTDPPVLEVSLHSMKGPQVVSARAYPLSSEEYTKELLKRMEYQSTRVPYEPTDTGLLTPVASFSQRFLPDIEEAVVWDEELYSYRKTGGIIERNYTYGYLGFHQPLPEGYYLVEIESADPVLDHVEVMQKPLQISDTSVYFDSLNGDALAWINDAATGNAVVGAKVRLLEPESRRELSAVTTGADGTAIWRSEAGENDILLQIVRPEANDYISLITASPERDLNGDQLYIHTTLTDRTAYKTTDQIHVWGVVRGRTKSFASTTTLRLEIQQGYIRYSHSDPQSDQPPLYTQTVELEADGSFAAQFDYELLKEGYYSIRIFDEDDVFITDQQVLIYDYEKPELVAQIWSDKELYLPGEDVDMNVRVTYYEGTPAYGLPFQFEVSGDGSDDLPEVYYTPPEGDYDTQVTDYAEYTTGLSSNVYTDAAGEIRGYTTTPASKSWRPKRLHYYFTSGLSSYDSAINYLGNSVLYFPSNTILQTKHAENADGVAEVQVTTHWLDTSDVTSDTLYGKDYPDNILGEAVDLPIAVSIYKSTLYTENELRTIVRSYNWAAQQTDYKYDYTFSTWTENELLDSYDTATQNGELHLTGLPAKNPEQVNVTYYLVITAQDTDGHLLEERVNLYPDDVDWWRYGQYEDWEPQPDERDAPTPEVISSYVSYSFGEAESLKSYSLSCKPGEVLELRLLEDRLVSDGIGSWYRTGEASGEGRLLYYLQGDNLHFGGVSEEPVFSVVQQVEYMPSVYIAGAYFDGRRIFSIDHALMSYDYSDQKLTVSLTTDGDRYGPGDEVTLQAQITDMEGRSVASRVAVAVVDQAALDVKPHSIAPLAELYGNYRHRSGSPHISYNNYYRYYDTLVDEKDYNANVPVDSANPMGGGGGGEGGAGGGSGYRGDTQTVRERFKDTAQFLVLQTDAQGSAQASFILPDNLTSWRITGAAVADEKLMAGTGYIHIASAQEMFLHVLRSESYLTGDDVGLSVTAQGAGLSSSTPIRYWVGIEDAITGEQLTEAEKKGRTDNALHFSFGQLPLGLYRMTVVGSTNDYVDAVVYEFAVVESSLELRVSRRLKPDGNGGYEAFHPARYPVVIGFADARYGDYLDVVNLLTAGKGDRLDVIVSAVAARQFVEANIPEEEREYLLEEIPARYAQLNVGLYNGGLLSLYPGGQGDVELTARILALAGEEMIVDPYLMSALAEAAVLPDPEREDAAPDAFDIPEASVYSVGAAAYFLDQRAAALMGRAALGEPVLLDLRRWLEEPELFTAKGELYLIAGLALLGDMDTAQTYYNEMISPKLIQSGDYKRMPIAGADDGYASTAAALMAASLLEHPDARDLAGFLLHTHSTYYDPVLELALYLDTFRPEADEPSSVQYKQGGETRKVDLSTGEVKFARFMREDLENSDIKALSGNVVVTACYIGGVEDFELAYPDGETGEGRAVSISRRIRPATARDLREAGREDLLRSDLEGLYTITLKVHFQSWAPEGMYTVYDRTPASLQAGYQTQVDKTEKKWRVYYNVDRQERTYEIYKKFEPTLEQPTSPRASITLTYFARQMYDGESRLEPVLVEHAASGLTLLLDPPAGGGFLPEPSEEKRVFIHKSSAGTGGGGAA